MSNDNPLTQEQALTLANLCGACYAAKINPLPGIRKQWGIPTFYNKYGEGRVFVSIRDDRNGLVYGLVCGDSYSSTLIEVGFQVNQCKGTFTVSKNW